MTTLCERLEAAIQALRSVSESPRSDAEFLLAHALGVSRARLHTRLNGTTDVAEFDQLVARRLAHEPVAYILGEWEFFSVDLEVRAPVLVPRPETEHLVEVVLDAINARPARILEIGTGSGCVSLALAINAPQTTILATDINPEALQLAVRNADRHGLSDRVEFREGSLFEVIRPGEPAFDVICSNPPYVEEESFQDLSPTIRLYEDPRALLAGKDGLDIIRSIIAEAPRHLAPSGLLALEMGLGHYATVRQLLERAGFEHIQVRRDLAGVERIAFARKPGI